MKKERFIYVAGIVLLVSILCALAALAYSPKRAANKEIAKFTATSEDNKKGKDKENTPENGDGPTEAPTEKPVEELTLARDANGNPIYPAGKYVYLTFDDGPSNNTDRILNILDEYGVKATFFVIYHDEPQTEERMKEIVKRGHTIAVHSYSHNYDTIYASPDAFWNDFNLMHDYIKDVTGVDSKVIRFPGGTSNTVSSGCPGIMTELARQTVEKGYAYFDWNSDSGDANGNGIDPDTLYNNIVNDTNTDIDHICVLMHDTAAKTTTPDALPRIIQFFKDNGYTFEALTPISYPVRHTPNN